MRPPANAPRIAWVLNLGVEDEFAGRATQSKGARERAKEWAITLSDLVTPGGTLLEAAQRYDGAIGRAFCPTPSALDQLARSGAKVPPAPSYEILRRVNHRSFMGEHACSLPGARFAVTMEDALNVLSRSSLSGTWVAKRPFGCAGRGHRRMRDGEITDADRAWLARALQHEGGVQLEPWVERVSDHGLHGYLSRSGHLTLGTPTAQQCDHLGRWQSSTPSPLDEPERSALVAMAEVAAEALQRAGYFGPFGFDAYRWRTPEGAVCWQWMSDLNARYSMGWATGMGEKRPDLED